MAYDPQKAHEYYLKHRKLKGRKKKKKGKKAKKPTVKSLMANMTEEQKLKAYEAQARQKLEKKEFTKQLNAMIKEKVNALNTEGMSEMDKAVAIEAIKLQFAEVKKQANAQFKANLIAELQTL